jgi:hypothetical protein
MVGKTVAALIIAVGLSLLVGSLGSDLLAQGVLGVSSAAALAVVDVFYSSKGIIRKIYLLDAIAELVFIVSWTILLVSRL